MTSRLERLNKGSASKGAGPSVRLEGGWRELHVDDALSNGEAPFGICLGENLYGEDRIVAGPWGEALAGYGDYRGMIKSLNLPVEDEALLISLVAGDTDYLADIPVQDKDRYLRNTSYASFLYEKVGMSPAGARLAEPWVRAMFGVGMASASLMEALSFGAPGMAALGLPEAVTESEETVDPDQYRNPMFPDGNASVARLFVRKSARDLCRLGRHKMLTAPFSEYEEAIRQQLDGMFGQYGFEADRDVAAITVNRWSHGYAYEYMELHDPVWEKGQAPHELGRKPMGRISIANSDSEAYAYVQAAIDAAIRAVDEVTG